MFFRVSLCFVVAIYALFALKCISRRCRALENAFRCIFTFFKFACIVGVFMRVLEGRGFLRVCVYMRMRAFVYAWCLLAIVNAFFSFCPIF